MQAEIIQTRDYNVASEAYIQCPNCTRKPQRIRATRKHIERDHAEKVTFECILKVDGVKCGFICGTHVGCFNKHQVRRHGKTFNGINHVYDESTGFLLRHEGEVIAKPPHSEICEAERDAHSKKGEKRSRDRYRAKKKNASKEDVSVEEVPRPSLQIVIKKRKLGSHEVVQTPAKKVKLNAKRVTKGKACKGNASAPSSGEDKAVTTETWKWTRKHAAMDVVMRNLEKAKAQPTAQETGLNAALEGFKGKPYVDGVTLTLSCLVGWICVFAPHGI